MKIEDLIALLLCAGLSRRFGSADKLVAPLQGRPLVAHAAGLLRALPFRRRIAVIRAGAAGAALRPHLRHYKLIENGSPEQGKDRSIRLGLAAALADGADAILLALGDMPSVTSAHLHALAAAADPNHGAIGFTGGWRSPPAIIPAGLARAILASDAPVGSFLAGTGPALVPAEPCILRDFDTPAAFASAPA